jgi:hypothetical protein
VLLCVDRSKSQFTKKVVGVVIIPFMPCLLSSGFDSLYCLGTALAHVARSNALGSLNTR